VVDDREEGGSTRMTAVMVAVAGGDGGRRNFQW
jgi:hypothetical protein